MRDDKFMSTPHVIPRVCISLESSSSSHSRLLPELLLVSDDNGDDELEEDEEEAMRLQQLHTEQ